MTELNAKQHTLIQALLSRGPMKEDQFLRIFIEITGALPGTRREAFDNYLLKINKALSYVQFELRGFRYQYDGQVYYGVVNNVSDEGSKLGTKYSVAQIAFYKAIIEAIVQDGAAEGTISSSDALNLRLENQVNMGSSSQSQAGQPPIPTALKNFSMSQKQRTIEEFVQDKWLSLTSEGYVGLGVRSFLDLRSWFRNNDVPSCEVCNEAGVKAALCQNESCTVRIHQYCLKKLKGERVCPKCATHWQYMGPKAEAVEDGDEPDSRTQSQLPAEPKRKKPRTNRTGDGDIVGSSSSQASLSRHNLRRSSRNSTRLH